MSELLVTLPFEPRRTAAPRAVPSHLRADTSQSDLVALAVRGDVDLYALESADYPLFLDEVGRRIIDAATPDRTDRLFPPALALMPAEGACPEGGACFGHGAAGVLWSLVGAGVEVPEELTDWLVRAAEKLPATAPGFLDGLAGVALTLDRLGRFDDADRLWRTVEEFPLDLLGTSLADGLAGIGLALLERAPVRDVAALMTRVEEIGALVLERLAQTSSGVERSGLLHGGTGAALFLLHLYALSEDPALLDGIEEALQRDIATLGWGPDGRRRRETPDEASIWHGSDGITMVLHEAAQHVPAPWLAQTYRSAAQVCGDRLEHLPNGFHARAGTLLAVQYLSSGPWTPDAERHAQVRLHLGRLDLGLGDRHLRLTGAASAGTERLTGAAGLLLALGVLMGTGECRLPFFW
ncbi:lanthionine synthetase C family protein [Georgenia subflava]|uniref:Lanthionine synthetase n=1 Tax=Georgenia subflava TaxID=1622177 RepID=A0A6N7EU40_9MICO|nr:lanthionine synthetase C family protein [Georgenia subflava]MPV38664.1 hypothetical protein [Georgenia subflava]